jgi:hypothetical protein
MLTALLAYDEDGNIIATLDHVVARNPEGRAVGLIDFEAHEKAGGRLRDIWEVERAVGSSTWPEWLGAAAMEFQAEVDITESTTLDGELVQRRGPIRALIHKSSGRRRDRGAIERSIDKVKPDAQGRRDIRHLVGGPGRPLLLDDEGRVIPRPANREPTALPVFATADDDIS